MKTSLCLLACLAAVAGAAGDARPEPQIPLDPGIVLVEGSGAVLGGAICAAGFGFLLTRLYDPSEDVWKTFGGTVLGGSLGYPVFCGLGCYAGGRLVQQRGTLTGALVGGLAATPVSLTIAWVGTLLERLPPGSLKSSPFYVLAALVPPAGAVLGYNLTRPAESRAEGLGSRIEFPSVTLAVATQPDGVRHPAFDVRLLSVHF